MHTDKYTPEVRAKMSAKASLRRHSAASRAKMSADRAGKKRGPYKGKARYANDTNRNSNKEIIDYQRVIREKTVIDPVTGCWVWQRAKNNLGYGFQRYKGKSNQLAHRVTYQEFVGPIPEGMNVLHRCDNPPCCNPDHLFTGTCRDNSLDMFAKGRHYWTTDRFKGIDRTALNAAVSAANTGSRWYTNGTDEVKLKVGVSPPDGYMRGRKPSGFKLNQPKGEARAALNRAMNTGKYWATNGSINARVLVGDPLPQGFVKGMRWKRAV